MAPVYTDLATLKLALSITDTARDSLLNKAIAGAEMAINRRTGRRFDKDGAASARTYRTIGRVICDRDGEALIVDDISTASALVVEVGDGTTWTTLAATDYDTEPDNATIQGRPITRIRYLYGGFRWYRKARVTAIWGWPAVPDDIVTAALIQAGRYYRRKDSPEGIAGSADWGLVRVPNLDPDVKAMLDPYMLPGFG